MEDVLEVHTRTDNLPQSLLNYVPIIDVAEAPPQPYSYP